MEQIHTCVPQPSRVLTGLVSLDIKIIKIFHIESFRDKFETYKESVLEEMEAESGKLEKVALYF